MALRLSELLPSPLRYHSETLGPHTSCEGEREPQPSGQCTGGLSMPARGPSALSSCLVPLTSAGLNTVPSDTWGRKEVQGNPHS